MKDSVRKIAVVRFKRQPRCILHWKLRMFKECNLVRWGYNNVKRFELIPKEKRYINALIIIVITVIMEIKFNILMLKKGTSELNVFC